MSQVAGIKQNENSKSCNGCNNRILENRQGFTFFSGNVQLFANERDEAFMNNRFIEPAELESPVETIESYPSSLPETGISNPAGKTSDSANSTSGACCEDCATAESEELEEMPEGITEADEYTADFEVPEENTPDIRNHVEPSQESGSGIIMGLFDDWFSLFETEPAPLPNVTTRGVPTSLIVMGNGGAVSISLHGTTDPNYDGGSGSTENVRTSRAGDCDGCEDDQCLLATGTLVLVFNANPVVTLPSRDEYDYLSPCQIERVEQWIRDVLTPHEQEHVDAFNTYDGTVRERFSIKTCRADWGPDSLQPIHDRVEEQRRSSAQQLSDDLDPFHTNIDLNCDD